MIGICFGTWCIFHLMQKYKAVCGVNWHPSLHVETAVYELPQEPLAEGCLCPHLVLTAGNDKPNMKPEGEIIKILEKVCF